MIAECTGAGDCPAAVHVHGCYADNGTNCDDVADHNPGIEGAHDDEW